MRNASSMHGISAARSGAGVLSAALAFSLFFGPGAVTVKAENDDGRISQDASDDGKFSTSRDDEDSRKAQRRRGLSARGRDFDPRVYEARGRELQGEYYEITSMAPSWSPAGASAVANENEAAGEAIEPEKKSHFWAWASGLALAGAAGAVGYYFLGQDQGGQAPHEVSIPLDDKP